MAKLPSTYMCYQVSPILMIPESRKFTFPHESLDFLTIPALLISMPLTNVCTVHIYLAFRRSGLLLH